MFAPGRRIVFLFLLAALMLSACGPGGTASPTAPAATLPESATGDASPTTAVEPQQPAAETVEQPAETPIVATLPAATLPPEQPGSADPASVPADTVAQIPDMGGFDWVEVASGLRRPLDLVDLGDGSGRLLVLEQPGVIRVIQNGEVLAEPFLDLTDRVGATANERGLLGIALHPEFLTNRQFYLNYSDLAGDTVIARFSALADDLGRADPGSEVILLQVEQPYANHNGGVITFGPDGYLYTGLGDGGSAGDPQNNGQRPETLLGAILRIDVDGGEPYAIPADNPFTGGGGAPEVWAYGLRNPWRFSFDRLTGDLYIADVGQNAWEEINFQPAGAPGGANYGWKYREGKQDYQGPVPAGVTVVDPVFDYNHSNGCSVTGGYVYRGAALSELRGVYFFGDYCSGKVWGMLGAGGGSPEVRELFQTGMNISGFGLDSQGELYLIDQGSGSLYRLERR